MNIYDFDGTIYSGDSTFDFYFYALGKKPSLARFWPKQAVAFGLYAMKKINKTQMKERFYAFLTGVDAEAMLEDYWDTHEKNIFPYYREQQREDDIIISASPEFLLKPICKRLGIKYLMASRVDPKTGKTEGLNCWGEEKSRWVLTIVKASIPIPIPIRLWRKSRIRRFWWIRTENCCPGSKHENEKRSLGPLFEGAVTEGDWGSVPPRERKLPQSRLTPCQLPQRGSQGRCRAS